MCSCLVTGGAGFIGSHLVEALLKDDRKVVVIDDFSTGRPENLAAVKDHDCLRVWEGDIRDRHRMADLIRNTDEIYHLAAVVGVRLVLEQPARTVEVNSEATAAILKLAAERRVPIFLASTSEVYGRNPKSPLSENDDTLVGPSDKSRWIYAMGKALDDQLALSYHRFSGLPVVIGRFFNTVGPRQVGRYGMVVPRFVERALAGRPLVVHGDGEQVRCFAHVADVVRGVVSLMACPQAVGRVFNIGSDERTTIQGLAERVIRQVNPGLGIELVPYEEVFGPAFEDIRCRVPNLSRIRQTIGYRPEYCLDDIIQDVILWKRDPKMIPRSCLKRSGFYAACSACKD